MAECTCFELPPEMWTTHYGAVEPGSTHEPNPNCREHFRKPPTRLIDGTWSDKVNREKRILYRQITSRWEVIVSSDGSAFVWQKEHHLYGVNLPSFQTAIAYADRMARTNQGENNA